MKELIAEIVLFSSLLIMIGMLLQKIPVLVELPEIPSRFKQKKFFPLLKEKIKLLNPFRYISFEIFLQKILSKIRILTLKIENKVAICLQKLREETQRKKKQKIDNYWQELKKSTKEKTKNLPE